ncbi:MAG: flagellar assembly protein FliW [Syntrophales bacterium]|jgi:flagellar assembly factor FliW|nr:flagellar assembly protein FliW [Syntrophales bacterium]MDY0043351.1 flagellar assembly protein FliW [Syntrophales bacterium]
MNSVEWTNYREAAPENRLIEMKRGILGFENLKRFVFLPQDETVPFWQLRSIETGTVFVVINPFLIKPDYAPIIPGRDVRLLEIRKPSDVILMSIITVRREPLKATANLRAPIVINAKLRFAAQVVLEDEEYPLRYPLNTERAL